MSTSPEERIQNLKREDRLPEALALCEKWMDKTEKQSIKDDEPVESWPYLQACIILRKLKRPADEAAVIERFIQQRSSGSKQSRDIIERLTKAYQLAGLVETRNINGQLVPFYASEGVPVDERQLFMRDAVIVDCETTGLGNNDEVIELALLRFRYSRLSGRILQVLGNYSGLREPACPISATASNVSGLSKRDVAGHRIDVERASGLVAGVEMAIAHNASFDRRMVTPLLPQLAETSWYCSMRSIDWMGKGSPSTKLQDIAAYYGIVVTHRAMSDAQTVFDLLSMTDDQTGNPIFHELMSAAPLNYVSRWQTATSDDGGVSVVLSVSPAGNDEPKKPKWKFW